MRNGAQVCCRYLLAALMAGAWHVPAQASGQAPDPLDSPKVLNLTTFATYPQSSPDSDAIDLDHPKDGSGRIFVTTNEGKILGYSSTGTLLGVFLDMAVPGVVTDFNETLGFVTRGLSYIAFHPDYGRAGSPGEGKLYTLYKTDVPGARAPDYSAAKLPTKPGELLGQFAIAEWTVDPDDPDQLDPGSHRELIRFEVSSTRVDNHSVGQIAFNPFAEPGDPDYGVLYIPLGDNFSGGGLHNWQHVQDADNPFGKVLRINPLEKNGHPYSVPADNPFADGGPLLDADANAEEIAALGFRYPQNLSFARDSAGRVRLLVFDIGADDYEEVNLVDLGDNHGWSASDGPVEVDRGPMTTTTHNPSAGLTLEFPAAVYDHDIPNVPGALPVAGSTAITGGFVVSDPDDPEFQRQVLFGDLPRGAFFHADFDDLVSADAADTQAAVFVMHVSLDGGAPGLFSTLVGGTDGRGDPRFGVDERGRVFIITRHTNAIYLTDLIADQALGSPLTIASISAFPQGGFRVEETTIDDIHDAIQQGHTTCVQVVQAYVDRARAYNGICTQLVTEDGRPITPGTGTVRAGVPLVFPSTTLPVSEVLPDYDDYDGLPIEFGRMEATRSDPNVQQQYGMVVGMTDAGQLNALSTLNLRGERSVTCQAECDVHPSDGRLPAQCPAVCEVFRQQPDALERAAELDAQYGRDPDLDAMPMYCVAFSFKDVFDTTDMRSTAGADASYAMDAPPEDSTAVAELRAKGAIIYAKANLSEYNAGGGNPGGAKAGSRTYGAGASRSSWAGTSCNVYDTAREAGGSGSAASVGANLVTCSICEETGGSCRQPAWRNGVVGFVTTKGLMPYGGSIGVEPYLDRAGIHCRTVNDAAMVLDALKDPERGYYDPRDIYTALPRALISDEPYESFTAVDETMGSRPLTGLRIGIVREYMVKHTDNDAAMSDLVNDEIVRVLRDELGAEIVESFDPDYPDDPSIPNMAYTFQQAIAEILPVHMPEYIQEKDDDADYKFAVPGYDVTTRDYLVKAAEGKAPLSEELNLRSINRSPPTASFSFHMSQYLMRRGDPRVTDWASLNANSKYSTESRAVAMRNWEYTQNIASEGITRRVKIRDVMRLVLLNVMRRNDVDVLVNPTITVPPIRIGYAGEPSVNNRPTGRFPTSANLGIPELTVPAGFNRIVYEPEYVLTEDKDDYDNVTSRRQTRLESPLPVGDFVLGGARR